MKKIVSLVLFVLLILNCLSGCVPKESGPVVICCEEDFNTAGYMEDLVAYLHDSGSKTEYIVEPLPKDGEERTAALTRLRTEIMAGEGPDVFILNSDIDVSFVSSEYYTEPLFKNPEKLMSQGIFYDISELVENSEIIKLDECVTPVMDAGVLGDSRYILPLFYTYGGTILRSDALKAPEAQYNSLEEIAASNDDVIIRAAGINNSNYFHHYFPEIADYSTGKLLITETDLTAGVEEFNKFDELQRTVSTTADWQGIRLNQYSKISLYGFSETGGIDGTVLPMTNSTGGVTAAITTYGAINASTESPNAAFAFLELLLADGNQDLMTGIEWNDRSYGGTHMGMVDLDGIPVKTTVYDTAFIGTSEATINSHKSVVERINAVKFYTEADRDILSALPMYGGTAPADVISKLQKYMEE